MLKFALVFLTLCLSVGANLSEGFLARMGFDPDFLMVALIAFVLTGLITHRHLALIVLVVLLTIGANASAEFAESLGYEPDYLVAALAALVFTPYLNRLFE
jgi:hypothetical protein